MRLTEKLIGYRRRAVYEWRQARNRSSARKREFSFQTWLDTLSAKPPDVLVGANFATHGGVRHHVQAIQRYSRLNVELAPPESVMRAIGPHHLQQEFRQRFLDFPATGIKVVHSHVFPWFINWCREKQMKGTRWVHTYHLNYFPEHGRNGLEPWQLEINAALINVACNADVKLSVSKWQREQLKRDFGIESIYLPNGVDVEACDRSNGSRFIKKTGWENYVLYVGRNEPVKNPADFVHLAARLPEFKFVMIGDGLDEATLKVDWNVEVPTNLRLMGGLSHTDVLDAIAACSILVVTSKREGLPTLVMEGMALRKVVVVPDEPGCREAVANGSAGLVYEQGNIDNLREIVLLGMREPSLGEQARDYVLQEFDWKVVIAKLDSIYS